jgi:hypothetical protein
MKPAVLVIILPGTQLATRPAPVEGNPFSTYLYGKYQTETPTSTKKWKA